MANALFVFDHIFPMDKQGNHYYSSGFDEDFFSRYFDIFEQFDIWGRYTIINDVCNKKLVNYPSAFYLFKSNKQLHGLAHKMSEIIAKYDCLVIRMPSIFGSIAIKAAKFQKKPYIVEIVSCEYDALSCSHFFLRRLLARPTELFYRSMLRNNPYNVYVTKQFLQNKYPSKGKQTAISNVTLPLVDDSILDKRYTKLGSFNPNTQIIIGTISTLNVDFKGQQFVIKAIPELKKRGYSVKYQMVGDGDGEWLINIAKDAEVENDVEIIGHLDHGELLEWLDTIDIYVHPSCQEGLSRAVIEAMSRACPIVAADAGGIHELIDSEFIVPKKNERAIAERIQYLIEHMMFKQAETNFNRSKEYAKCELYAKRKGFFKEFMETSGVT